MLNHLAEFIEHEQIVDPAPWPDDDALEQVRRAGQIVGWDRMKPIFETLPGTVSYEHIRMALACLRNRGATGAQPSGPPDRGV